MAEGDAPAAAPAAAAAAASPRSPMPQETPAMQKRRQRGLVSRVWKGIFGGREDVEKLLQALSKEEEAVRARLRRRARASRQSAHNVLALAAALEVIRLAPAGLSIRSYIANTARFCALRCCISAPAP
jgi:endoplasmic reticulum junction formation protein lunapark